MLDDEGVLASVDGGGGKNHTCEFGIGEAVQLGGLTSTSAEGLNGRLGTVVSGLNQESLRYDIRLDGTEPARVIAVKPKNLTRRAPADSGGGAAPVEGAEATSERGPLAGIARLSAEGGSQSTTAGN